MKHHLKFKHEIFHAGENVTIRRGVLHDYHIGDMIESDGGFLGRIVLIQHFRFCDIPLYILEEIHDRRSQTVFGKDSYGLLSVLAFLSGCYTDFQREEIVTVITFVEEYPGGGNVII